MKLKNILFIALLFAGTAVVQNINAMDGDVDIHLLSGDGETEPTTVSGDGDGDTEQDMTDQEARERYGSWWFKSEQQKRNRLTDQALKRGKYRQSSSGGAQSGGEGTTVGATGGESDAEADASMDADIGRGLREMTKAERRKAYGRWFSSANQKARKVADIANDRYGKTEITLGDRWDGLGNQSGYQEDAFNEEVKAQKKAQELNQNVKQDTDIQFDDGTRGKFRSASASRDKGHYGDVEVNYTDVNGDEKTKRLSRYDVDRIKKGNLILEGRGVSVGAQAFGPDGVTALDDNGDPIHGYADGDRDPADVWQEAGRSLSNDSGLSFGDQLMMASEAADLDDPDEGKLVSFKDGGKGNVTDIRQSNSRSGWTVDTDNGVSRRGFNSKQEARDWINRGGDALDGDGNFATRTGDNLVMESTDGFFDGDEDGGVTDGERNSGNLRRNDRNAMTRVRRERIKRNRAAGEPIKPSLADLLNEIAAERGTSGAESDSGGEFGDGDSFAETTSFGAPDGMERLGDNVSDKQWKMPKKEDNETQKDYRQRVKLYRDRYNREKAYAAMNDLGVDPDMSVDGEQGGYDGSENLVRGVG